jgi:hypothetical protein
MKQHPHQNLGIQSMLLQQTKNKKKLLSEQGEIIPSDDILTINDIQQGRRVLKYHEYKIEK